MQGTRLLHNFVSGTDARIQHYNKVFDELLQLFQSEAGGDTLVTVYRILGSMEGLEGSCKKIMEGLEASDKKIMDRLEAIGNVRSNWASSRLF